MQPASSLCLLCNVSLWSVFSNYHRLITYSSAITVELGHTNFQIGKEGKAGLRKLGVEPSAPEPPATGIPEDDGTSVVVSRLPADLQAI